MSDFLYNLIGEIRKNKKVSINFIERPYWIFLKHSISIFFFTSKIMAWFSYAIVNKLDTIDSDFIFFKHLIWNLFPKQDLKFMSLTRIYSHKNTDN